MSILNSWCSRVCLSSVITAASVILIDFKADILPIHGIWLVLYILLVLISALWLSCMLIQKLLKQNRVFKYNLDNRCIRYLLLLGNSIFIPLENLGIISPPKHFGRIIVKKRSGSCTPDLPFEPDEIDSMPVRTNLQDAIPLISIDERIELLTSDIENRFISKWYKFISNDDSFTLESKELMESVVRRVLQVSVQLDCEKITCGALVVLLKHLKEYRKAIKRAAKNGGNIESNYRYSHIGTKSETALEHFTHRLTGNVLHEFISWELWNSLPSRLLVSILSKRLTKYMINYISQPGWINYKLVSNFASKEVSKKLNLSKYCYISLSDVNLSNNKSTICTPEKITPDQKFESSTPKMSPKKEIVTLEKKEDGKLENIIQTDSESMLEKALTKMLTQHTAPILQRAEKSGSENETPVGSVKQTPEKKATFSPKRSEPVKIHSAKSASKCWDDGDLTNISVGQDLLALEGMDSSDIQGFSGRRLWGPSLGNDSDLEKPPHPLWDINEIFKDSTESEKEEKMSPKLKDKKPKDSKSSPPLAQSLKTSTTNAASIITNTIKPIGNVTASTLHNMRELQQSTVNNVSNVTEKAIHKIGDLQDEAVGVVEGIFDFGMAGIRKGLRLTGLQDSSPEIKSKNTNSTSAVVQQENIKHQSPKNAPKLVKIGHITSEDIKKNSQDSIENVWINPLAKESPNGYENQMLFEKSPTILENPETVPEVSEPILEANSYLNESPEYEETADLASTISKLRSLLQQKSSESSLNTPAASPMPMEEKTCLTPSEPATTDAIRNDGGMQRFARTVTGMFNTFKGALPGNTEQIQQKNDQWIYIENETSDTDLPNLLNSLLIERRDYCTVDTAYEAMDSLDMLNETVTSPVKKIPWDNRAFEDELDDMDPTIPLATALMDVICECFMDTNCALKQEPIMKALMIITGHEMDLYFSNMVQEMPKYINKAVGPLPKNDNDFPIAMNLEEMVKIIRDAFPGYLKHLFGEEDIRTGLKFLISSLQSAKINQDIILQLSEIICSQLIFASSQMSPTPSA